jgi:esterase/lipase
MNRKKYWLLIVLAVLVILYVIGPNPDDPQYSLQLPALPAQAASLEQFIEKKESTHQVKPDNEARIVWANDSSKNPTEYSIVYLHGFTASQAEGEPLHRKLAKKFGCNLYLSRLSDHGIDTTEPMVKLTVDRYWESAKEALAIGRQIGKKVILMATSTGGTLALRLAADYPFIHSLLLLSPNIEINDPNAWLLNNPWGLQIAKMVTGGPYMDSRDQRPLYKKYWTHHYRLEAAVALQELIETSMTGEVFGKVKQPVLLLYYYKDEIHQDSVVKVSAMQEMFSQLGTPPTLKKACAIPTAGDHVIASYIRSNDLEAVEKEATDFLSFILRQASASKTSDH